MKRIGYQPAGIVTGPAYSPWFKMLATLFTFGLAGYAASFMIRQGDDLGTQALMLGAILLLLLSYRGFLHATVTIDADGIRQTGLLGKDEGDEVEIQTGTAKRNFEILEVRYEEIILPFRPVPNI